MDKWPGRPVNEDDVRSACGHPLDWFATEDRMEAHQKAWQMFWASRERRTLKGLMKDHSWNQVLIAGEYGSGKTGAAATHALRRFRQGHPVFSNCGLLFGWRLEGNQLFTAMGRLPYSATLLIDEGHAALAGRLAMSTAVGTFQILSANIRKLGIEMIIMSAQDRGVSRQTREMCAEVWRPWKASVIEEEDGVPKPRARPADDRRNFAIGWDVWEGFPYRMADLSEGPVRRAEEGWGEPQRRHHYEEDGYWQFARMAYALTDSFSLVDAGEALLADSKDIKEDVRGLGNGDRANAAELEQQKLLDKVAQIARGGWEHKFVTPLELAGLTGLAPSKVGVLVGSLLGVRNERNHGYPADKLIQHFEERYEVSE